MQRSINSMAQSDEAIRKAVEDTLAYDARCQNSVAGHCRICGRRDGGIDGPGGRHQSQKVRRRKCLEHQMNIRSTSIRCFPEAHVALNPGPAVGAFEGDNVVRLRAGRLANQIPRAALASTDHDRLLLQLNDTIRHLLSPLQPLCINRVFPVSLLVP